MVRIGLNRGTIEDRLRREGITNESLISAIANIIVENNREIEKRIPEIVEQDTIRKMRAKGML